MCRAIGYRIVLCGVVALLSALAPAWGQAPAAAPGAGSPRTTADESGDAPRIEFTTLEHDFGRAPAGEDLKTTFVFKNVGDAVLVVQKVKGG
jgi:hypothetical protein